MLYSYRKQYPKHLPFRIVLSNGMTRTDPTTFTVEEIADAGYVQAPNKPEITEYQSLSWNGTDWAITDYTQEEIDAITQRKKQALIINVVDSTQKRLDTFALTRQYDNVNSISKYQNITDEEILSLPEQDRPMVTKFRTECRYLALVTAQTWATLYNILDEVETGLRPPPTGYSDIESELPTLVWPN